MDGSRHTATKYLSDGKFNGVLNNKVFRLLGSKMEQLYDMELGKLDIEWKKPIFFGVFILLNAYVGMPQL